LPGFTTFEGSWFVGNIMPKTTSPFFNLDAPSSFSDIYEMAYTPSPIPTPTATPTPTPAQTPAAPTNLLATAISSSQIALSWTDNSTNENGFRIQCSSDGVTFALIATVGVNVTTYTDNGLTTVTTYYYRARAYNSDGNSALSNVGSATTLPASTPTPGLSP
jgi:hypothetical protein